jgi:hypothetical protein
VTEAVQLAPMNRKVQSLIDGGFVSPLTLAIILNCSSVDIDKLLRGEAVDNELAESVKQLVEQYQMAMSRVNVEALKASISEGRIR